MNKRHKLWRIVEDGYERLSTGQLVRNPKKKLSRRKLHRLGLIHKSILRHAREAAANE